MKRPGKLLSCVLAGLVVQVPALLLLLRGVLDMHNRFSVLLSVVLPYSAIADRLKHPSFAVMLVVFLITLFQYPLYGTAIGQAWVKGRPVVAIAAIGVIHAIAGATAIYMKMAHV